MRTYKGYIKINGIDSYFIFSDFLLRITIANKENIGGWEHINSIVTDNKIQLIDFNGEKLTLFVEKYEYLWNDFGIHIAGFISYNSREENDVFDLKYNSLLFTHTVIDYFLSKRDISLINRYIDLLSKHRDTNRTSTSIEFLDSHIIKIKNKNYTLKFGTISDFEGDNDYPIFSNYFLVESNYNNIEVDDIIEIVYTIRSFLKLVSQSFVVNINHVRLNMNNSFENNTEYPAVFHLKPTIEIDVLKTRVLRYEDLKPGIENIFNQISENSICFRSLFSTNPNEIFLHDIVNICAAFESQFSHYEDKEQKDVKKKMLKYLEQTREDYSDKEKEHFDVILKSFSNVNNTLKKRLEIALNDFISLYREKYVEFGFKEDYSSLPERIVKARNAIAHGNLKHPMLIEAFTDTILLRAITYMLILRKAGISDKNIINCINKMSYFPH